MKSLRIIGIIGLTCCLFVPMAQTQSLYQFGGNLTIGLPQGEFGEEVDNVGIGGTGFFALNFPQSPLAVGASLGFMIYGSETREESWSSTIPDIRLDVTTTNNILNGHLFLRVQPPKGGFLPYLDGLIGFNYLWTETSVKDEDEIGGEEIASSRQLSDITFSYGVGGGLMFRVYQAAEKKGIGRELASVYIDLGLRYLKGGEAEYLKEESIIIEDSQVYYNIRKSTTDILTIHIGASFAF